MHKINKLLLILLMGICAGYAYATPSTLVWIPSTDIQAEGVNHLGIDTYVPSSGDSLIDYGLTFGNGKFEFGVDYLKLDGISDPTRLNAKMLLKDETPSMPRLTAGIYDAGGDAGSRIIYLVGSKTYSAGRFTFGYGIGKESVLGEDNKMLLLGFDKAINNKWWATVDYQSGKSAMGALSAGVTYNFTPNTSTILGYDWYNDSSLSDTITLQLDMNF